MNTRRRPAAILSLAVASALCLGACSKPKGKSDMTEKNDSTFDLSGWTADGTNRWRRGDAELKIEKPGPAVEIGSRTEAAFRDSVRAEILRRGGALVSADLSSRGASRLGRVIAKFPQKPSGMTYEGWLSLAKNGSEQLLTVRFPEAGVTGMRDTVVMSTWLGDRPPGADPMEGWMSDPYDPTRRDPLLKNVADDARYDTKFPQHPLSLVRAELRRLESSLPAS
jgi:hypothetical protein